MSAIRSFPTAIGGLALLLVVATQSATVQAATIIDLHASSSGFTAGTLTANSGTPLVNDASTGPTSEIIGGERLSQLDYISGAGAISAIIDSNGLVVTADSGVVGTFSVRFNAGGSGLGLDVTGDDFVSHDFTAISGSVDLQFRATDVNDRQAVRTALLTEAQLLKSEFLTDFAFFESDGTTPTALFDGTNISMIEAAFTTSAGGSFTLGVVQTQAVPEPSSVALLAFGAAACGYARRRRRKLA